MPDLPTDANSTPRGFSTESLVVDIVWELADVRGVDPRTLPPLYESVDVDALGALFELSQDRSDRLFDAVAFGVDGDEVRVTSDGTVSVTPGGVETDTRSTANTWD
jgi:hypothetical protein